MCYIVCGESYNYQVCSHSNQEKRHFYPISWFYANVNSCKNNWLSDYNFVAELTKRSLIGCFKNLLYVDSLHTHTHTEAVERECWKSAMMSMASGIIRYQNSTPTSFPLVFLPHPNTHTHSSYQHMHMSSIGKLLFTIITVKFLTNIKVISLISINDTVLYWCSWGPTKVTPASMILLICHSFW